VTMIYCRMISSSVSSRPFRSDTLGIDLDLSRRSCHTSAKYSYMGVDIWAGFLLPIFCAKIAPKYQPS